MSSRSLPQLPVPPARKPGERCCDPDVAPAISTREAKAFTSDLEILAHPVRLQLLEMLTRKQGSVCVCDLEDAVPVKQPTVSHHLRLLRNAGLVQAEKQGLFAYYRVDRGALGALRDRITSRLGALG